MAIGIYRRQINQVSGRGIFGLQIDQGAPPEAHVTNSSGRTGVRGLCIAEKTIAVTGVILVAAGGTVVTPQGKFTSTTGQVGTRGQAFYSVGEKYSTTGAGRTGTLGQNTYSATAMAVTAAYGQAGTLGQAFYSVGEKYSTTGEGRTGTLGSAVIAKNEFTGATGSVGTLGVCAVLRSSGTTTIGAADVKMILDGIIAYDALGNPVSLGNAIEAGLAVLCASSSGFPGAGEKVFRSLDGTREIVKGTSDAFGNRETNPEFDFGE